MNRNDLKGIGSSDAPAVCGVAPWKSAWQLCLEKMGDLPPQEPTEAMELGLLLEPVVAHLYSARTGEGLQNSFIVNHRKFDWMFCSPDRFTESGRLVELKTANAFADGWGEPGTDAIPDSYLVQVHHQMECCERDECDVAVLIGGQNFRIYTVKRNQRLIDSIVEQEREFWRRVGERDQPSPDFSLAATQKTVRAMHGVNSELEVTLGADELILAQEYLSARDQAKLFDDIKETAKSKLLYAMGEAHKAILPEGTVLSRRQVNRKGYEVKPSSYTTFNVKRPK